MAASPFTAPSILLEEVRALASGRGWAALVARVGELPQEDWIAEPEVGLHLADALWRVGRSQDALQVAEPLASIFRTQGNQHLLLNLTNIIGIALFGLGRNSEAEDRWNELLAVATEAGGDDYVARASNNLGMIANIRGNREAALLYYGRALAAYRRLGQVRGLAQTHHNLGISYRDLGFAGEADRHFQRAIELAQPDGNVDVIALAESERAMLRATAGDGRFAEVLATRALRRFDELGDPLGRGEALRVLAAAARASQQADTAAVRLDKALQIAQAHGDPLLHAEVQRDRGLLLRDTGDPVAARAALLDAATHFAALGANAEAEAVRAIAADLPA